MKLTTHLHLVPRSRICGAIILRPNMPSWCGAQLKAQVQLYLLPSLYMKSHPSSFLCFFISGEGRYINVEGPNPLWTQNPYNTLRKGTMLLSLTYGILGWLKLHLLTHINLALQYCFRYRQDGGLQRWYLLGRWWEILNNHQNQNVVTRPCIRSPSNLRRFLLRSLLSKDSEPSSSPPLPSTKPLSGRERGAASWSSSNQRFTLAEDVNCPHNKTSW